MDGKALTGFSGWAGSIRCHDLQEKEKTKSRCFLWRCNSSTNDPLNPVDPLNPISSSYILAMIPGSATARPSDSVNINRLLDGPRLERQLCGTLYRQCASGTFLEKTSRGNPPRIRDQPESLV